MTQSKKLPLSRYQFQDALRKGLGRAMLHVRQFGTDGLEDDILHACLHSLLHDTEMENTRGFWLFGLLRATPHLEGFREPILAKLKNATPETVPYWDAYQLMILAFNYAGDGSKRAYQIIHEKFGEQVYAPEVGGHQIIMLDGLSGFLHIAEVVGARLKREVDFRDNGGILWSADDQFGEEQVTQALRKRSKASPNVAAFEHLVNQQRARKTGGGDSSKTVTLSEFLTAVEHDGDVPWLNCRRFAQHATAEELDEVFIRLLGETERSRLLSYLEVFAYAKLPRLDDRVFELARSADDAIRDNAVIGRAWTRAKTRSIQTRKPKTVLRGTRVGERPVRTTMRNAIEWVPYDQSLGGNICRKGRGP